MTALATALTGFFLLLGSPPQAAALAPTTLVPSPAYSVRVTAYNAVSGQTDGDPSVTASGAHANPAVVAARSRDLAGALPFGTVIAFETPSTSSRSCGFSNVAHLIGYRVIADTMNARFKNSVDVLLPTTINAITLGVCDQMTVRVVGHLDLSDPRFLPKTQKGLAILISGGDSLAGLALR